MDELKSSYIESLSERVESLVAAKKELLTNGEEAREVIRRISHTLSGSGGTYGFPEISHAAALTEESSGSDVETKLDALLKILNNIISEHSSP